MEGRSARTTNVVMGGTAAEPYGDDWLELDKKVGWCRSCENGRILRSSEAEGCTGNGEAFPGNDIGCKNKGQGLHYVCVSLSHTHVNDSCFEQAALQWYKHKQMKCTLLIIVADAGEHIPEFSRLHSHWHWRG